jgi:DNA repair protein RecN (Recombination protein N)
MFLMAALGARLLTGAAARRSAVLVELGVRNLLLIESAELALDTNLNAITGETGAGKTMLAQALDLLLGAKPRRGIVRPGAEEAYVEGVFEPPATLAADPELAELAERIPLDVPELVLGRRVVPDGPTRSYLQGRSVSAQELRAVASRLVAFFGQHEHRRLMVASAQLAILDAFCGEEHLKARSEFESRLAAARAVEHELTETRARLGARERDLDFLEFEIAEIESVAPGEDEEPGLERERDRLGAVEMLRHATSAASEAIAPSEMDSPGAMALLAGAAAELRGAGERDEALGALASRAEGVVYELEDIVAELRSYLGSVEADPGRLAVVEERLEQLARLKRKHGGTIEAVLEHAERCRAERDRLLNAGETTVRLEAELERDTAALDELAARLRAGRAKGGRALAKAVCAELGDLAMAEATFEVVIEDRPSPGEGLLARFGPAGADSVEFLIGPNPGVAPGPLREVASGGELSRVMLALMSIATSVEGSPTVVFDEVDAGVGGATARAVGERLRALSASRQVLCITHLPQVASLATRHFRVVKQAQPLRDASRTDSGVARADIERLNPGQLVEELCRMLGADAGDEAARRHAERLLEAA